MNCQARLLVYQSRWDQAETVLRSLLEMLPEDNLEALYHLTGNLGFIQRLQGKMDKAISNHQLCLQIAEAEAWPDAVGEAQLQLGLDYAIVGQLKTALTYLQNADMTYTNLDNPFETAIIHKSMGMVLLAQGQLEEARQVLQEAEQVLIEMGERFNLGHVYGNLGNIAVLTHNYEAAKAY